MSSQRKTVRLTDSGIIPLTDLITDLQRRTEISNQEIRFLISDLTSLGQVTRSFLQEGLATHNQSVRELAPQLVLDI